MRITWRRTHRVSPNITVRATTQGVGASVRKGRVTVSTRGRATVRLGGGFSVKF